MPKLSDVDPERRDKIVHEYGDHAETLRGIQIAAANDAQSLLWATNGGAAIALIAFMGSNASIRDSSSAWVSLASFFVGIIALGVLRAVNYHFSLHQLDGWLTQTDDVINRGADLDAPRQWLAKEINRGAWLPIALGYFAFTCFVFGGVWAATHLPQLAHAAAHSS